jgi:hypothetical protein
MDELLAEIERMPVEAAGYELGCNVALKTGEKLFTANQMNAHARRIAALALEAAADECETMYAGQASGAECATAIRAMAKTLGE